MLRLDDDALIAVRDALAARLAEGLVTDGGEIQALPAWLPPPPPSLAGEAIVVDTGGTNMRAALVALAPGAPARVLAGPVGGEVPRDPARAVDAAGFFRLQAELVAQLAPPPGLPLGYCFSYPSACAPDGDAVLLKWTKGIRIAGVEGARVGSGLRAAVAALGLRPGPVRVLNDTVAALLAGARRHGPGTETIGLIVGTGTNMAAFLTRPGLPRMALNLESGNFDPPGLSRWDAALDAASDHPGRQRFEKAVSGYYLPHLFRQIFPDSGAIDPARGSGPLAELRRGRGPEADAAGLLLERSADLVGAAIAGVCLRLPPNRPVAVTAEGSLFWKTPGFRERATATARRLLDPPRALDIDEVEHANLAGSACAALLA
ncbi:MAG: hypothetical protein H8E31_08850 [Planctomycetes bacterium]|nr:hypothetical protein [Planctomycetota bacterium]